MLLLPNCVVYIVYKSNENQYRVHRILTLERMTPFVLKGLTLLQRGESTTSLSRLVIIIFED